jgi:hypothetical protein
MDSPNLSMPYKLLISPVSSAHNLGVVFDSNLSPCDQISSVSKCCLSLICDLCRIRSTINYPSACDIDLSLIHSKLDYGNFLFLNFPAYHLDHLQLVLTSAARAIAANAKFHHITSVQKSLHWL